MEGRAISYAREFEEGKREVRSKVYFDAKSEINPKYTLFGRKPEASAVAPLRPRPDLD